MSWLIFNMGCNELLFVQFITEESLCVGPLLLFMNSWTTGNLLSPFCHTNSNQSMPPRKSLIFNVLSAILVVYQQY